VDESPWHQAVRLRPDWRLAAACRESDPELFFPAETTKPAAHQIAKAKAICLACPVRTPCLGWALKHDLHDGIWGGTTEQERRALRVVVRGQRRLA
jgi:WhiB family transcriptional regulator, redox-sensing transcriptional regulator